MSDEPPSDGAVVSVSERAFYVSEFAGSTIVVSMTDLGHGAVASLTRAAVSLAGRSRLVVVAAAGTVARSGLLAGLPGPATVIGSGAGRLSTAAMAELWLALTDGSVAVVEVGDAGVGSRSRSAAELAVALGALKLVVTDPEGGWGRPARSFVDVHDPARGFEAELASRQDGAVVDAVRRALDGGVTSVNLCPADLVDEELFTFDGVGSLFTRGDYLRLDPLRVDDLPAVESLVAQGVADGLLRTRPRSELARLAVEGLGARVRSSGHLAGLVGLEVERYGHERVGEVACLYTVSRFSGAGAGGLLVDGLVADATERGLRAVFAVTVSDAAGAFFDRKGFVEVDHDRLPAAKWEGYDPERRRLAHAWWRTVADVF